MHNIIEVRSIIYTFVNTWWCIYCVIRLCVSVCMYNIYCIHIIVECSSPNNAINCYERFHGTRSSNLTAFDPYRSSAGSHSSFFFLHIYFFLFFYCPQSEHVLPLRHCYHIHTHTRVCVYVRYRGII